MLLVAGEGQQQFSLGMPAFTGMLLFIGREQNKSSAGELD